MITTTSSSSSSSCSSSITAVATFTLPLRNMRFKNYQNKGTSDGSLLKCICNHKIYFDM